MPDALSSSRVSLASPRSSGANRLPGTSVRRGSAGGLQRAVHSRGSVGGLQRGWRGSAGGLWGVQMEYWYWRGGYVCTPRLQLREPLPANRNDDA
eukprot:5476167-Pyramimonas_sp.AAC.2